MRQALILRARETCLWVRPALPFLPRGLQQQLLREQQRPQMEVIQRLGLLAIPKVPRQRYGYGSHNLLQLQACRRQQAHLVPARARAALPQPCCGVLRRPTHSHPNSQAMLLPLRLCLPLLRRLMA